MLPRATSVPQDPAIFDLTGPRVIKSWRRCPEPFYDESSLRKTYTMWLASEFSSSSYILSRAPDHLKPMARPVMACRSLSFEESNGWTRMPPTSFVLYQPHSTHVESGACADQRSMNALVRYRDSWYF
jgi:hypothetical protein